MEGREFGGRAVKRAAVGPPRLTDADRSNLGRMADSMLMALRSHGTDEDGSVTRLAYTHEWQSAMTEVERWFDDGGLEVSVDAAGNRFGRLAGDDDGVVLSGSHLDSVRKGGAYDGALGIVLATCALTWLRRDCGRPRRSMEVFAGSEEESSRFPGNFWGIRAILGLISPEEPEYCRDANGTTIGEAMRACGLHPEKVATAARSDVVAFIEPHIEQGPVLESHGLPIGVVERVVGVRQLALTLTGNSGHAGTTPMKGRRDPLVAAAEIALEAKTTALEVGGVATVGCFEVDPGGANQVPRRVSMTIDFRNADDAALEDMHSYLTQAAYAACERNSVHCTQDFRLNQPPAAFDPKLRAVIESVCESNGCGWMRMTSGAGHDAQVVASQLPAAMFFVPSEAGVSHQPQEYTAIDCIVTGIEVLIGTLFQLGYAYDG